ncbi:ATP-binding protein [Psychrosphaera sp. 1_MG-2023]|uniref:ATP-binding protein n=1 Tax=Psychrosphaera sp. 1_MG-2023 TaxID=3062643 RepID=UPI0034A31E58
MGSIKLTAVGIEKMATPEKRKDVYDSEVAGLVLRLLPSGTKSWSYTYRVKGKAKRLSLGVYPGVSLKLARERARDARAEIQRGNDPVEDKKAEERERQLYSFENCAKNFVEGYCKPNLKTWKSIDRALERFAIPAWGDRPAKDIRRRDVVELLDKVAAKTAGQSNHLRAYLSKMFKWLIEREVVEINPVQGVARRHKSQPRSQVLFELIAHRYERGSMLITSNQAFSEWDSIFGDNMMTVAAIDRLVHHSEIYKLEGESYRKKQAIKINSKTGQVN